MMIRSRKTGSAAASSTPAARRLAAVLTRAASCLLVLSACSLGEPSRLPYRDVRPSIPAAAVASPQCPRDGIGLGAGDMYEGSGPAAGTLPATFKPELVRYCRLGDSVQANGGLRYTVTEETSPVSEGLLTSLALPDQEFDPRDHAACAASYGPPAYLLLVDAKKQAYRPYLPVAPCSTPRVEVQAAINSLNPVDITTYTFDRKLE